MKKVLIINADYYKDISKRLVFSAKNLLKKNNINLKIINVPGIFETPFILRKYINRFDAFVVLGCVIKELLSLIDNIHLFLSFISST